MSRVLIVGTGPSAAFAVQACRDFGAQATVWTDRPPAAQEDGAFFIHWLPPALAKAAHPVPVRIESVGTARGYTMKQWLRPVESSFPAEPREELWFNSADLMALWRRHDWWLVGPLLDERLEQAAADEYDWVFHTYPVARHRRGRTVVWFEVLSFSRNGPPNGATGLRILYNGDLNDRWVRMTESFGGRVSIEFPRGAAALAQLADPVFAAMSRGRLRDLPPETEPVQPYEWLAPNCLPLGRFAEFDRTKLSHHSYERVMSVLRGGVGALPEVNHVHAHS